MFTTADNRALFCDLDVAAHIEQLGIQPRELFSMELQWDGKKDSPRAWRIARIPGEQPNGTFAVPALPEAARKPVARELLVDEANSLVDAYAEVLDRALTKHGGRVKPDEVRSILLSAYIQRRQLSSVA